MATLYQLLPNNTIFIAIAIIAVHCTPLMCCVSVQSSIPTDIALQRTLLFRSGAFRWSGSPPTHRWRSRYSSHQRDASCAHVHELFRGKSKKKYFSHVTTVTLSLSVCVSSKHPFVSSPLTFLSCKESSLWLLASGNCIFSGVFFTLPVNSLFTF